MILYKDYFNKNIHYRMLRHVVLSSELEYNKMNVHLFESDIQCYMDDFLRLNLSNTGYFPKREVEGKTDLVVYETVFNKNNVRDKKAILYFEIKTVIKKHEALLNSALIRNIEKDLLKLHKKKDGKNDIRSFFILVLRIDKEAKEEIENETFKIIDEKLFISSSRKTYTVEVEDENDEIIEIKLRASRKCKIENTIALSWEILSTNLKK